MASAMRDWIDLSQYLPVDSFLAGVGIDNRHDSLIPGQNNRAVRRLRQLERVLRDRTVGGERHNLSTISASARFSAG